jgi:hypothetical protein
MQDLLFGALAGDMAALNGLFFLLLPFALIGGAIKWLWDKASS